MRISQIKTYALLAAAAAIFVGCASTSGGAAGGGGAVCAPADTLTTWTPVGGTFTPENDKCGKPTAGTFTVSGAGGSFEKSIRQLPQGMWYLSADLKSDCADVTLRAGGPTGAGAGAMETLSGGRFATAGYVGTSELSLAVLVKTKRQPCDVKIAGVNIDNKPPAGMAPAPMPPGSPARP